jgi:hypothetical protein
MRAEFWVAHEEIDANLLKERLERVFGGHDLDVLNRAKVFSNDRWRKSVIFSREDASYRLICFPSRDDELQVHVEPINANALRAAESAWRGIKKAFKGHDPRIADLNLVDDASNRPFLSGRSGLGTELRRRETLAPLIIAGIVGIYGAIGTLTFAKDDPSRFLFGATSGVATGLIALAFSWIEARKGVLRWH